MGEKLFFMAGVMPKCTSMTGAKPSEKTSYPHPIQIEVVTRKETGRSSEQEMELQQLVTGSFSECLCIFCGPEDYGIYKMTNQKEQKQLGVFHQNGSKRAQNPES